MASYKYRFQNVLDIKEKEEEDKRIQLQRLNMQIVNLKNDIKRLEQDKREKNSALKEISRNKMSLFEIKELNSYIKYLNQFIKDKSKKLEDLQKEAENKKNEYMNARKDKKTYEKLKEKDYEQFLEKELKEEEKIADQIICFTNRKI